MNKNISSVNLQERILQTIETFPDFPKKGILFRDISPIFADISLFNDTISAFADFSGGKVDAVCGIESRGYLFGLSIAARLEIPFYLIRKKGKLPPPVVSEMYELEYGNEELEMRLGQLRPGSKVLIHDDLLATGGTTCAAANLVQSQGAQVEQFSFLIGLKDLDGRKKLEQYSAEIQEILVL